MPPAVFGEARPSMACLPQKDSPSSAAWARQGSVAGQNVHFQGKGKVAQSHLTLCDPVDHTVHGILQAGILVTIPFSRGPSDRGTEPRPPSLQSEPLGGCWAPGPTWVDLRSAASDGAQPQAESELALAPGSAWPPTRRAPRTPLPSLFGAPVPVGLRSQRLSPVLSVGGLLGRRGRGAFV